MAKKASPRKTVKKTKAVRTGGAKRPAARKTAARALKEENAQGLVLLNVLNQPAIGSIRLKALRRGAQDCEYLITLAERYNLNREQLRALVAAKIPSKTTYKQKFEDEAAAVLFDQLDPEKFAELREGVAKLIVKKR